MQLVNKKNPTEIQRALELFKGEGSLIEIRAFNNNRKGAFSGFFKSINKAVDAIMKMGEDFNFFFTMNTINDMCYAKDQRDKMVFGADSIGDTHIECRDWILIDLDPCRMHLSISSSDEEKAKAYEEALKIRSYLRDNGFAYPIVCDSGNGYHLLYKTDHWGNTEKNNLLAADFLKSLAKIFSDKNIDVDVKVANPSRIVKLYGTMARKGSNVPDRPHRLSKILSIPKEIKSTPKELFQKIVDIFPKEVKQTYRNNYGRTKFDIDNFIAKHCIGVKSDGMMSDGTRKIILNECPFNSEHKAPDSAIFVMPSGAIAFTCFHSSCANYKWADVRRKYEPNYREDNYVFKPKPAYNRDNWRPEKTEIIKQTSDKGEKWRPISAIKTKKFNVDDYIPTGWEEFDNDAIGLKRGHVTILSGITGSGKTSLLTQLVVNWVDKGYRTLMWSGEMSGEETKDWFMRISAGKNFVHRKGESKVFETNDICVPYIEKWAEDNFKLYNNRYGRKYGQISSDIKDEIEKQKADVVVLDNLMKMDIRELASKDLDQQTALMNSLIEMAETYHIHIILVAHPNKSNGILRRNSVAGSGNITNLAQNLILLHRVKMDKYTFNRDFERDAEEFWGKGALEQWGRYSNIIEFDKYRATSGITGKIYGFYYEVGSGRFLNNRLEYKNYGWMPETMTMDEDIFPDDGDMPDYGDSLI